MKNKYKIVIFTLLAVDIILLLFLLIHGKNIAIFNPKGLIALKERNLLITGILLSSTIVIPVFIITFLIAWKYRANNTTTEYSPEWTGNNRIKYTLWIIPAIVMAVLAILAWKGAHALDPYRPFDSTTKPLIIQVVALNWKWLFIYPKQKIATVNYIQFPAQTPITFELTADAPMNSFWIPQLGGQMYAMPGMQTKLHLIADAPGDFDGSEVEINGSGFAGMKFTARASSLADFTTWVQSVKESSNALSLATYDKLAKPSEYNPRAVYSPVEENLYNRIIMKYMPPPPEKNTSSSMHGMNMKNYNF